ncbi:MAG: hypothetical protein LAQ69_05225 [Acidobacteriia bacterium]|nr:hypothetical protein [Terriglobia bacterium]
MKKIVVVEPQCLAFEHAQFNAALLATIANAFPQAGISFWADARHHAEVALLLREAGVGIPMPDSPAIEAHWPRNQWRCLIREHRFNQRVMANAQGESADLVVFSSISNTALLSLKLVLGRMDSPPRTLAFVHSILAGLSRRGKRFWNWPLGIRTAVSVPTPPALTLIGLSGTILRSLAELHYDDGGWAHLDHPYIFSSPSLPREPACAGGRTIAVGLLGALRRSQEQYAELIGDFSGSASGFRFALVGHLATPYPALARLLPDARVYQPVSYAAFASLMRGVDYVLMLPDRDHHRWAVSCALLDAYNHFKPGFFLNTPLVREYRERFGDFGYFADSLQELRTIMARVGRHFSPEEYRSQQDAICRARNHFEPACLAPRLRSIVAPDWPHTS